MQDAELAVTLLYELGEGASEDAMKPGTGALAQLAQGRFTNGSVNSRSAMEYQKKCLALLLWRCLPGALQKSTSQLK